ncbi:class I SAM-dependent methyltransferase [Nocardia sp. NPDC051570]|uniref:class I SAM-dependent methyltransferase n=1 Tax=Nocardia sp. NPDC051570 TaxID=3364324 RepID=UPI0037928A91
MADRDSRALSFGSVATDYDRYRPGPPIEALDWLLPPGAETVLDLAAGTGAVTRELIGRVPEVIAVEPDQRMLDIVAERCPEALGLVGRPEDIPLADASVDAVLISAAWHWLDPELAIPEIARVLRPGGVLGVIWNHRDPSVPWITELNELAAASREADRPAGGRNRTIEFPPDAPFSPIETHTVTWSLPMTREEIAGLLTTYSGVITLPPDQRDRLERNVREFLDRQPWTRTDVPMICRCLRTTRR